MQANFDWFDAEAKRKLLVELEFALFLKPDEKNWKKTLRRFAFLFSGHFFDRYVITNCNEDNK